MGPRRRIRSVSSIPRRMCVLVVRGQPPPRKSLAVRPSASPRPRPHHRARRGPAPGPGSARGRPPSSSMPPRDRRGAARPDWPRRSSGLEQAASDLVVDGARRLGGEEACSRSSNPALSELGSSSPKPALRRLRGARWRKCPTGWSAIDNVETDRRRRPDRRRAPRDALATASRSVTEPDWGWTSAGEAEEVGAADPRPPVRARPPTRSGASPAGELFSAVPGSRLDRRPRRGEGAADVFRLHPSPRRACRSRCSSPRRRTTTTTLPRRRRRQWPCCLNNWCGRSPKVLGG